MSKREPKYVRKSAEKDRYWLRRSFFEKFDPGFIGLTDLAKNKETFEGLAVILDLKDFTSFCDQRDPHHEVPAFLGKFLRWLFQRIRQELLDTDEGEEVVLWSHLPIFGKFLGDGVLFLWDVTDISPEARRNLIQAFDIICSDYTTIFLEKNKKDFTRPPSKLRCGIAQGQVTSIAKGTDYVGLCINIASRLQKLADDAFSFGFTKKGLDEKEGSNWYRNFRLIRIPIRGVANPELVYVLKSEFSVLPRDRQRELRVKLSQP